MSDYDPLQLEKSILEFDIISFLEEQGVDYSLDSKNVGADWIGVNNCPFCDDASYHFGLNKETKQYNCWICSNSGSLFYYMKMAFDINFKQAVEIVTNNTDTIDDEDIEVKIRNIFKSKEEKEEKEVVFKSIDLPKGNKKITSKIIQNNSSLQNLFKEKHITLENVQSFDLRIVDNDLIIPVYFQQKVMAYQLRRLTYKRYHNTENLKHFLFDYDSIPKRKNLILVEGVFDFNQINNFLIQFDKKDFYCTTSFSKSLTQNQIDLINELNPKSVLFLLDRDFWFDYQKYCGYLCCPASFLMCPRDKDPNMMTEKDFLNLGL